MIEVEQKFQLDPASEKQLLAGAILIGEKTNHDIYFDNAAYELTTSDRWLRLRNGHFEYKIPVESRHRTDTLDRYHEITDEQEIARLLKLHQNTPLSQTLIEKGFKECANYKTRRREYRLDDFIIDVDTTTFGHHEAEVELQVKHEHEVAAAAARIQQFAHARGLSLISSNGKTPEYIRQHNPAHFHALQAAGIVR